MTTSTNLTAPTTRGLLAWLISITRPVLAPLAVSTLLRIINLTLDVALFGLAGATVAASLLPARPPLRGYFLALIVIAVLKALAYYGEQFSGHYVAFKALELLRVHAFSRLVPKAPGLIGGQRSGDMLASLTRDVDRIEVVYAHTFAPVVSAVIVPAFVLTAIGAVVDWRIVVIPALCCALAVFAVPFMGMRRALRSTAAQLDHRGELSAHVTDSVFGIEEVVGYGREADRLAETDRLSTGLATVNPALTARAVRRGSNHLLFLVSTGSVIAVGLALPSVSWQLTLAAAMGSLRLFEGPRGVEDAVGALDASLAATRRLWRLCHSPAPVLEPAAAGATFEPTTAPEVRVDAVSYTYPGQPTGARPVFEDLVLHIPAGQRTVFIGSSGSGKTTAAHLIARFADPDSGRILIGGTDSRVIARDVLYRFLAYVPQEPAILDASIAANLRLGAPEASDEDLWEALETCELAAEVRAMPAQLGTPVGQSGSKLSGGQCQRLALARAMLQRPRLLILDEFTANLNAELDTALRRNLASWAESNPVTIIEIAHRESAVTGAAKVYRF